MTQTVKSLPAMQESWVRSLGWEDPLKKGMATLQYSFGASLVAHTVKNLPAMWQCAVVSRSVRLLATPWDCSPPGSSVHGILQARILEWVASFFSSNVADPVSVPGSG